MTTTRRSARLLAKAATSVSTVPEATKSPGKRKATTAPAPDKKSKQTATSATGPRAPVLSPGVALSDPDVMEAAVAHLKAADPKLGAVIDGIAEQCTMSLPRDKSTNTSFISLCQSVIYQQLAGSAARAILRRFLRRYGTLKDEEKRALLDDPRSELTEDDFYFPTPEAMVRLDVEDMRHAGLSQRKGEYLKAVAEKFHDGTLSDTLLAGMSDSEVSRSLVAIRGIGQWTADMFLMFHLKRPNVLPTLDLAVRKGMAQHFGVPFGKKTPAHNELVELAQIWEPYRSVATWYMWRVANTITQKS
ncbi:hypothetical protein GGF46_003911 [Coemansia sp. RSA 552]|nr:hypothetical protein GGF46_003911 [Coemansia sp. RSA 552]